MDKRSVCLHVKYGKESGREKFLSASFIVKCLTGTEDPANESPASVKEVSRWQGPVLVATTLCSPLLLAKRWQAHYLICASRHYHEMAGLVLLLSPSVDKANKMTGFI